jgi:hypothetical protein
MSGLPEKSLPTFAVRPAQKRISRRALFGRSIRLSLLPLGAVLLISCVSAPRHREEALWIGVLPALSPDSLYASFDVASSRALLETLFEPGGAGIEELDRLAGRLSRVDAVIRPFAGQKPCLYLLAQGRLSPTAVSLKLNNEPGWRRVVLSPQPELGWTGTHWSYRTYWYNQDVQIAAPRKSVLLLAVGDPGAARKLLGRLHSPGPNPLPSAAAAEAEKADIFLFLPDPPFLAAAARTASVPSRDAGLLQGLPIRQGWISARAVAEGYELHGVLALSEQEDSRSLEVLLRLLLTVWMRRAQVSDPVQKLKALTMRADGGALHIDSLLLSAGELASFFRLLIPEDVGTGG